MASGDPAHPTAPSSLGNESAPVKASKPEAPSASVVHPIVQTSSEMKQDDKRPARGTTGMSSTSFKKRILRKWTAESSSMIPPLLPAADLPVAVKRRRYPKLLALDENGVPVSPRSAAEAGYERVLRTELSHVSRLARERFGIRMNLRGRTKLEVWITSAEGAALCALRIGVEKLSLDARVLDGDRAAVRAALGSMPNQPLRVMEALHTRVASKDGIRNWLYIAANGVGSPPCPSPPLENEQDTGAPAYAPALATVVAQTTTGASSGGEMMGE